MMCQINTAVACPISANRNLIIEKQNALNWSLKFIIMSFRLIAIFLCLIFSYHQAALAETVYPSAKVSGKQNAHRPVSLVEKSKLRDQMWSCFSPYFDNKAIDNEYEIKFKLTLDISGYVTHYEVLNERDHPGDSAFQRFIEQQISIMETCRQLNPVPPLNMYNGEFGWNSFVLHIKQPDYSH